MLVNKDVTNKVQSTNETIIIKFKNKVYVITYHLRVTNIIKVFIMSPLIHVDILCGTGAVCIEPVPFLNFAAVWALHNPFGIEC